MKLRVVPLILVLCAPSAWAAPFSLQVGLGPQFDLGGASDPEGVVSSYDCGDEPPAAWPEYIQGDGYRCGVSLPIGGRLDVRARIPFTDRASLRVGPSFEVGTRPGALTWTCDADDNGDIPGCLDYGEEELNAFDGAVGATGHFALTGIAKLSIGPEISVPVQESNLFFGSTLSLGAGYSFASLGAQPFKASEGRDTTTDRTVSPTDGVLNYRLPDCQLSEADGDQCAVEARVIQPVFGAEIFFGWRSAGGLFVELAYGTTVFPATPMQPGYAEEDGDGETTGYSYAPSGADDPNPWVQDRQIGSLDLQHARYVWNPVRVTVGLEF